MLSVGPHKPGCDHVDLFFDGAWIGYRGNKGGALGLQKCPVCRVGNYALSVSTGTCYQCGWSVHDHELDGAVEHDPHAGANQISTD